MRSLTLLTGLAAAASAQLMPLSQIANIAIPADQGPTVGKGAGSESFPYNANSVYQSTYNSVFAKGSTMAKRNIFQKRHDGGDCSPQPLGAGPHPSPDTPAAFETWPAFASAANSAQTPSGWVKTFTNLNASSQAPMGYLGYDSISTYDPSICVSKCNALSGCFAFDLYFERDPVIDPGANCTNPNSTTIIKCAYWGTTLEPDTATNDGQYCADFQIVIAGSNGYVRQNPGLTVTGYNGTFIGNSAINAPTQCNSYIGYQLFNDGQPFDPNRCAAACAATSAYNIQYLNGRAICRFFDTYILSKNGVPQGQYCAMYTRSWDISYATNNGQTDSQGNQYTISYSYIFSNSTDPGAQICDATCMSQQPCPGSNSSSSSSVASSSTSGQSSSGTGKSTTPAIPTTTPAAPTTTPAAPTTTPAAPTTTPIAPTTTRAAPTTTPAAPTTTPAAPTTTRATSSSTKLTTSCTTTPSTTMKTSTSTSAQPSSTQCFKLRNSGPSWLNSLPYVNVGSSGKLSPCGSSSADIFSLDNQSRLTSTTSGQCLSRSIESYWNPSYGYLTTQGSQTVTCSKSNGQLTFSGASSASNGMWVSPSGNGIMNGIFPGSSWTSCSLIIEYCSCPSSWPSTSGGSTTGSQSPTSSSSSNNWLQGIVQSITNMFSSW